MKSNRLYASPLRESQAKGTRERILSSVATWMSNPDNGDFTFDEIARESGVQRRTVFRHFVTKEALLESFWVWINADLSSKPLPSNLSELVEGPRELFPQFDEAEGVIRGSLHTQAGRAMRQGTVAARRKAIKTSLREATLNLKARDRQRIEAVAHALYSAAAWETMRDYAGITGEQAGDAASWALAVLTDAIVKAPKFEREASSTVMKKQRNQQ